ncbi:hypothetical protein FRACYDRAFT_251559 [Fragilariopsis cylindrus CCMP1102]|uniref:Uncharacterized protein n=1 Tax=Fragilariopsis cylindrus CCMP1102 TaxID=635003 RepID=A0A1E7EMU1_9STRA|nr:hypothetical protein FRACYDRAFT_251559 [Fragilariopsis cylindrus CCMP1102]|eukprot:OEU07215.1 hypothetical protein FRACYDRAFT_251559 [Fragilariopsis cylindrus CCMP1102]
MAWVWNGWGQKLAAANYFYMNLNNAYKLYSFIYKWIHPGRKEMPLKECIHNLTHSLLQRGDAIQPFESPPAHAHGGTHAGTTRSSTEGLLVGILQPDRVHQPMPCLVRIKDPDKAGSGPYFFIGLVLVAGIEPKMTLCTNNRDMSTRSSEDKQTDGWSLENSSAWTV